MYSIPMPFGLWNLWPLRLRKSQSSSLTSIGTWLKAWVPSEWNKTPILWDIFAISAISYICPISLLTNIWETKSAEHLKISLARGAEVLISVVCGLLRIEWCSYGEQSTLLKFEHTQLLLSVAPDVKNIWLGSALIAFAIWLLAVSTALWAVLPREYNDDGLPYCSVRYGIIASRTGFVIRVVAALSR